MPAGIGYGPDVMRMLAMRQRAVPQPGRQQGGLGALSGLMQQLQGMRQSGMVGPGMRGPPQTAGNMERLIAMRQGGSMNQPTMPTPMPGSPKTVNMMGMRQPGVQGIDPNMLRMLMQGAMQGRM